MTRRRAAAKTPPKGGRGRGASPKAAGSDTAAPQAAPAATRPRTHIVWDRYTGLLPVAWNLGGADSHIHEDDSDAPREDDTGDDVVEHASPGPLRARAEYLPPGALSCPVCRPKHSLRRRALSPTYAPTSPILQIRTSFPLVLVHRVVVVITTS